MKDVSLPVEVGLTCNVLVQDGVLIDDIVEQPATVRVDHEDFPLQSFCPSASGCTNKL